MLMRFALPMKIVALWLIRILVGLNLLYGAYFKVAGGPFTIALFTQISVAAHGHFPTRVAAFGGLGRSVSRIVQSPSTLFIGSDATKAGERIGFLTIDDHIKSVVYLAIMTMTSSKTRDRAPPHAVAVASSE